MIAATRSSSALTVSVVTPFLMNASFRTNMQLPPVSTPHSVRTIVPLVL